MLRVLLVDDEEIFLNFMQHIIPWQQHGCTIVGTATSGEEAIEQMRALSPDIVFCDINMASISGLDVCAFAKAEGLACKMIITTAHDSFSYARQAIALNVFEYLLKPFDQEELLAVLVRCIAQIEKNQTMLHHSKDSAFYTRDAIDKKTQLTQRLDQYLQAHFHESDLTTGRIADDLFYESSYIRKIYKEKTGKTISQALEELRIARAKELLRSDHLQSDIAAQCGFSNQFYFSKRFKQICGCSPSVYKSQHL